MNSGTTMTMTIPEEASRPEVTTDDEPQQQEAVDVHVQGQIHDLRVDLQRVHPDGLVGNLLCWWLWPIKFVGDPLFGVAEAIVPFIASKVPFTAQAVELTCQVAKFGAHKAYSLATAAGIVSSDDNSVQFKTLSFYLSLMELSPESKELLLRKSHESAGALQFLLGTNDSMAASLMAHSSEVLTMLWDGYGALYNVRI